jgi:hypothetical protein
MNSGSIVGATALAAFALKRVKRRYVLYLRIGAGVPRRAQV